MVLYISGIILDSKYSHSWRLCWWLCHRNLIGGAPAIANDERINATGATGTKIPGRYIPVNQGFFVLTSLDEDLTGLTTVYGGDIVFENSQRAFKPETPSNSVFMRNFCSKCKSS